MPLTKLSEQAARSAMEKLFDPPLSESQITSAIRQMNKMIDDDEMPEDYAFSTAIEKYRSHARRL